METTEKVVEAYVRYVKHWATIPNIKCSGQFEIDLLAIDPKTGEKYHIESGVNVPGSFSKLTCQPFDEEQLKIRGSQATQRRTLGYFAERKFSAAGVIDTLAKYGFSPGSYKRVIVTWGWKEGVKEKAIALGIELWHFAEILRTIGEIHQKETVYFTDDTLRTLQMYAMAVREK
jgi:hypothetical protein